MSSAALSAWSTAVRPAALAAHRAPDVEGEDDVLVRLGLELPHRQVVAPRARAPVDVPDLVAALIGAQALELGVAAAHAEAPEARVLSPLPAQELERPRRVHVRVDVDLRR